MNITIEDVKRILENYIAATDPYEQFQYANKEELTLILQNEEMMKSIAILASMSVKHVEKALPSSDGWTFKDKQQAKKAAVYQFLEGIYNGCLFQERVSE